MENISEKKKEKRKVNIRMELDGELAERFLYLKKKYGYTGSRQNAKVVTLLIMDKYSEFKAEEEENPASANCDEVDIFEGDIHVARISVHKEKSNEALEHINEITDKMLPKDRKKILVNGKEIKVG